MNTETYNKLEEDAKRGYIFVICPVCKKERYAWKNWVEKHGTRCLNCSNLAKMGVMLKGGIYIDNAGYRYVYLSSSDPYFEMCNYARYKTGGYVQEHRLVIARFLNRPLIKTEKVHHKNGVVSDNRIENLELKPSQASHIKIHWANGNCKSNFHKGHIPWNKGLTKETDPRVAKYAIKVSESVKKFWMEKQLVDFARKVEEIL